MRHKTLTFSEAVAGTRAPQSVLDELLLVSVEYVGFDGAMHVGQLVVHADLADEVVQIFAKLVALKFPIEKIVPITLYDWNDVASMNDNNSSAFNYRYIAGTEELSKHSFGCAIDINPRLNPYVTADGVSIPKGAKYALKVPGTIGDAVVNLFAEYGWGWGGLWGDTKGYADYQHFEKLV